MSSYSTEEWKVHGFDNGHTPSPKFYSFKDALAYYDSQKGVVSYVTGKPRKGRIHKITTVTEDVTPLNIPLEEV